MAETIGFYSFKGGVGRSLSLTNVAAQLANSGYRVVCIDYDLEAGGLHTIFDIPEKNINNTVLDLLVNPELLVRHVIIDISNKLPNKQSEGKLWLLPAITVVDRLTDVSEGGRNQYYFLTNVIKQIEEEFRPHFILIDSRSGFAEFALPIVKIANRLVCVLRPNKQNAMGLKLFLEILDAFPEPRKKETFIVLSQVPEGVPGLKSRISELHEILGNKRVLGASIPYNPELALEEKVISILSPDSNDAKYYEPIVKWISKA